MSNTAKDRALAIQAGAYPLNALLNRGVPVDVEGYAEMIGLPLRPDGRPDPRFPPAADPSAAEGPPKP